MVSPRHDVAKVVGNHGIRDLADQARILHIRCEFECATGRVTLEEY